MPVDLILWPAATLSDLETVTDLEKPGVRSALRRLGRAGATEDTLFDAALARDGYAALGAVATCLFDLVQAGRLAYVVRRRQRVVAMAHVRALWSADGGDRLPSAGRVTLSRFAYLRRDCDRLLLESPLTRTRISLAEPEAAVVIAALAKPMSVRELSSRMPTIGARVARDLVELLWQASMLSRVDSRGNSAEDQSAAMASWEFHDLLFHARSRSGRHDYPSGGTYPLRGASARPPVVKPPGPDAMVSLPRPDLDALAKRDPPFIEVLESRRSVRRHAVTPLSLEQLGEFLYRTMRLKAVIRLADSNVSRRPYPSGGASYELEAYVAARQCSGLAPGLYHYDPAHHALGATNACGDDIDELLRHATAATGAPPQVLIVLTGRFARVSWKYSSVAYAIVLKDVGVALQTMYLTSTAMGLAGCAIGNGDSDLFARMTGSNYYEEASVGEFMLGTAPPV